MPSTRREAEYIVDSAYLDAREKKNKLVAGKSGPNTITKIYWEDAPVLLEAVLTVIPDFDQNNRLFLAPRDAVLCAMILKEISKTEAENIRQSLRALGGDEAEIGFRGIEEYWLPLANSLIGYADTPTSS